MDTYFIQLRIFIFNYIVHNKVGISLKALIFSAVFFSTNINASATASDYILCQKIAVEILSHCIKKTAKRNHGRVNSNTCWESSKQSYDSCVTKVVKSYNPEERKKLYLLKKQAEEALKKQRKVQ